ncbi:MAG: asparagine synthase (glutamine-hydrolyzing), partial [Candidatus Eiseniibacteriota bacterium]
MCGIAGILRIDPATPPVRASELVRLGDRMPWRGPDDEGFLIEDRSGARRLFGGSITAPETFDSGLLYAPSRTVPDDGFEGDVGLTFRRLAILDLSAAGHQPMCDPTGRFWILFNGEVYNFIELRQELEGHGHVFRTRSDTEVVLAAFATWGEDMLPHLNGMWGMAIWDARERRLFIARDRFGVKPVHYRVAGGRFTFASELKPIVLDGPRVPRAEAIHALVARDWVDHTPETFFEGVYQLPAGHCLSIAPGDSGPRVRRWWNLEPGAPRVLDARAAAEEFRALFTDAVRIRLRSDVPVGTCLSGGLDSSAIVVTAASLLPHPMRTFSVAYDEGSAYDERRWIEETVRASGADPRVVVPDGRDLWETLDEIVWHQEEPAAGPGLYSQWHVMKLAGRGTGAGMKVLLDGQGGDELLAGYHRYYFLALRDLLAKGELASFARAFWGVAAGQGLGVAQTAAKVALPLLPAPFFDWGRRTFGQGKDRVLGEALRPFQAAEPRPPRRYGSQLSDQLAWDMTARFLPSLLRYEDRNSMAFSIETRLPFLDYRLALFAFSLAGEMRIRGTTTKALLRDAMADRVPPAVVARRDKKGYETPTDVWIRTREAARVRDLLLGPDARSEAYLDRRSVARELDEYLAGRRDIGLQVWRWIHLELWLRTFVDGQGRAAREASGARRTVGVPGA